MFIRKDAKAKFLDQFSDDKEDVCDIVVPVESKNPNGSNFGFPYGELLELHTLYFVSKKQVKDRTEILLNLANSTIDTWPLFVVAITMAFCAGAFIWILVR